MEFTNTVTQSQNIQNKLGQIMTFAKSQLTVLRKKCMVQTVRLRPTMIMKDETIEKFIENHLIEKDGSIYFKGESYYLPELWKTNTPDEIQKIVRYAIEKNTIR